MKLTTRELSTLDVLTALVCIRLPAAVAEMVPYRPLSIIADIVLNNTDRRQPELPVHSIDASNAGSIISQHLQTPISQRYALPSDGAQLANLPR